MRFVWHTVSKRACTRVVASAGQFSQVETLFHGDAIRRGNCNNVYLTLDYDSVIPRDIMVYTVRRDSAY